MAAKISWNDYYITVSLFILAVKFSRFKNSLSSFHCFHSLSWVTGTSSGLKKLAFSHTGPH